MNDFLQVGRKKELFYITLEFDREINDIMLLETLMLTDKYYSGYKITTKFGEEKEIWHDAVFAGKISNMLKEKCDIRFHFDMPYFFQKGNHVTKKFVTDSCSISLINHSDSDEKNSLLFHLYADLFTDIVYVPTPPDWKDTEWYQKKAAQKNRKILSDFLKALESMLEGSIVESLSDYHLNPNSIFKYGIKEDATCEKPTVFD
jgi:hypothetical protein